MSEPPVSAMDVEQTQQGVGVETADHTSAGLYLAGQRRLRGISIDELSARTRIPRRNIERLEAGAFDAAPDGFSRSFVRTVAQALGLDADEAVMRLMSEPQMDEALLLRERRLTLLLRGAVLSGGVLVGVAIWQLFMALSAPVVPGNEAGVVYRRDPVKLLAAEAAQQARAPQRKPGPEAAPPAPPESADQVPAQRSRGGP